MGRSNLFALLLHPSLSKNQLGSDEASQCNELRTLRPRPVERLVGPVYRSPLLQEWYFWALASPQFEPRFPPLQRAQEPTSSWTAVHLKLMRRNITTMPQKNSIKMKITLLIDDDRSMYSPVCLATPSRVPATPGTTRFGPIALATPGAPMVALVFLI